MNHIHYVRWIAQADGDFVRRTKLNRRSAPVQRQPSRGAVSPIVRVSVLRS